MSRDEFALEFNRRLCDFTPHEIERLIEIRAIKARDTLLHMAILRCIICCETRFTSPELMECVGAEPGAVRGVIDRSIKEGHIEDTGLADFSSRSVNKPKIYRIKEGSKLEEVAHSMPPPDACTIEG